MSKPIHEALVPGTHVRTPHGLAWVNVSPTGEATRRGQVFVRLSDDSTRWLNAREVTLAGF